MFIPASYISKMKKIDWNLEAFQLLDGYLTLENLSLPSPFPAFFTMLEMIDSQFYLNPLKCSVHDYALAVFLLHSGQSSFQDVYQYANGVKDPLNQKATQFLEQFHSELISHFDLVTTWIRIAPWTGFEMIPSKGGRNHKIMIYDAEWLASIVQNYSESTSVSPVFALWYTPLARIGHIIAQRAASNGVKIRRPEDPEEVMKQIRLAEERDKAGILHPWQIQDPFNPLYKLTENQVAARFEIVTEFENAKAVFLETHKKAKKD